MLGDSITWGLEPICEHDRYEHPYVHLAKRIVKPIFGKGCKDAFDISKALPQYNFIVMGYPDARSDQMGLDTRSWGKNQDHVAQAMALSPDVIVLLVGTNDIKQAVGIPTILKNIESIKDRIGNSKIKLLLANVPLGKGLDSSEVVDLNSRSGATIDYFSTLQDHGVQNKTFYHPDGIHPNTLGYEAMLPALRAALHKELNP